MPVIGYAILCTLFTLLAWGLIFKKFFDIVGDAEEGQEPDMKSVIINVLIRYVIAAGLGITSLVLWVTYFIQLAKT